MFVNCPHCNQMIEIIQLNCRIFRCGVFKVNFTQIDPHLSKSECMRLLQNNLIFGCGKPFRILEHEQNQVINQQGINQQGINQQGINQQVINQQVINQQVDLSNNTAPNLIAVVCDYI